MILLQPGPSKPKEEKKEENADYKRATPANGLQRRNLEVNKHFFFTIDAQIITAIFFFESIFLLVTVFLISYHSSLL